jgi:hypothetical protein
MTEGAWLNLVFLQIEDNIKDSLFFRFKDEWSRGEAPLWMEANAPGRRLDVHIACGNKSQGFEHFHYQNPTLCGFQRQRAHRQGIIVFGQDILENLWRLR